MIAVMKTLPAGAELRNELEIKRSRFITVVRRVASPEEARALVADARDEFPDARHHCSAWVISTEGGNDMLHSSDDGEPSGTAGRPMLDALAGSGLSDVAAVVVRYFGGTLLGTGGLVRAYTDSVNECLRGAAVVERVTRSRQRVHLRHDVAGRVEADLRARGYEVVDVAYGVTAVELDLAVDDVERFSAELAAVTAGTASATDVGTVVTEVPAEPIAG